MARNTNIDEQLFPVWQQPVYLEKQPKPIPGFKAIAGNPNGSLQTVFSIVSDNYQLVSNKEALEMGKQIHAKLFPNAQENSFEIFNVIAPASKSFCHIDIIDKNYTLNIWQQEVYVPFVRIHNSYNRSRSLQFDIGFCRKLCDNGMIFEQQAVKLKFAHTKQSISLEGLDKINVEHLKKLEQDFISKTSKSTKIQLPKKYFVPLAAKTLNRTFNIHEKDSVKKKIVAEKIELFTNSIDQYSDRYINKDQMGETAYAFYNVITDFASNNDKLQASAKNGLQTKCGMWINQVGELVEKQGFKWEEEIKDFEYLLKN
ncbi:MAG: DUF932 domain-containing protein [Niastella sp.]|nr:DUF932 domain-containing protein [Niastella sp.]